MKLAHVRFLTSKKCGRPDMTETFIDGRNGHSMDLVELCGAAFVRLRFTPKEGTADVAAVKYVPVQGIEEMTPLSEPPAQKHPLLDPAFAELQREQVHGQAAQGLQLGGIGQGPGTVKAAK